jgi:CTP synthase (UTP-ammonia lyase)
MRCVRVGLVGDYDSTVVAHRAIPIALEHAGRELGVEIAPTWLSTAAIDERTPLGEFDGLWCVPASPYASTAGALRAIRFAREQRTPFLGTCGGFQHAVIEFARHVLGVVDAENEETAPDMPNLVITRLACDLVDAEGDVEFAEHSIVAQAYGVSRSREGYRCRFGLAPTVEARLHASGLRCTARDSAGDVRAVELDDHPFFVATLFQPERAALKGTTPPLVVAFTRAALIFSACRPAT